MKQILPGIKSIKAIAATKLPYDIDLHCQTGLPVTIVGNFTPVAFIGTPTGELTSEYDHKYYVQTLSVTLRSTSRLAFNEPTCFVVTTVNGNSFIVGTREGPYPQLLEAATSGTPEDESSGYSYEIRYVSPRTLRECVTY